MSETSFTPGPWMVSKSEFPMLVFNDRRGAVCNVCFIDSTGIGGYKEKNANAALISAAPEMYDILKHYFDLIQRANDGDTISEQKIFEQAADIEKVLKKARGEE